jgi:hypothetical protein
VFELLASFVQRNRRRVLLDAMVGVESTQAQHRFKAATARQIDPGVVAVVTATPREAS